MTRRQPFAAVNLISDPIHGYVELTKTLARDESAAAGLPDEDVAEEDLLDSAWLQRLRRISQLQSARWVFPTAEHSRFTHGLGVMHEAGLWARSLYPSLRTALASVGPRRADPDRGPRRRDAPDGRPAPRRRARAVRPLLRRPRPGRVRRATRRSAPRGQAADPRGPVAADHRGRARAAPARAPAGAGRGRRARRVRGRRGDRSGLGRVPRLEAGPRRPGHAAVGPLAPAAAVGRVHGRQPRLRPAGRVPDRRRRRARSKSSASGATRSSRSAA